MVATFFVLSFCDEDNRLINASTDVDHTRYRHGQGRGDAVEVIHSSRYRFGSLSVFHSPQHWEIGILYDVHTSQRDTAAALAKFALFESSSLCGGTRSEVVL